MFIAFKKSDIRTPDSIIWIKSAEVMGDLNGAFYKLPVRLFGWFVLSKIVHCHPPLLVCIRENLVSFPRQSGD
jgi:hypothetical protein